MFKRGKIYHAREKRTSSYKTVITEEKAVGIDIFLRTAQTVNKDMKFVNTSHHWRKTFIATPQIHLLTILTG
jgi:hypothetical protein